MSNHTTINPLTSFSIDALNAAIGQTTIPGDTNLFIRKYRRVFNPSQAATSRAPTPLHSPPVPLPLTGSALLQGRHSPPPPPPPPPPNALPASTTQSQHVQAAHEWQDHFSSQLAIAAGDPVMQNQESENLEAAAILLAMGRPIGGEGEEETARQKPFGKDGISFPAW